MALSLGQVFEIVGILSVLNSLLDPNYSSADLNPEELDVIEEKEELVNSRLDMTIVKEL